MRAMSMFVLRWLTASLSGTGSRCIQVLGCWSRLIQDEAAAAFSTCR